MDRSRSTDGGTPVRGRAAGKGWFMAGIQDGIERHSPYGTPVFAYGAAVLSVLMAVGLRLSLAPMDAGLAYVTLLPAIVLACYLGGVGPTVVAVLLATAAAVYFFLPPYGAFAVEWPEVWSLALFLAAATLACVPVVMLRRSLRTLRDTAAELKESRARLRRAQDAGGVGDWEWNLVTGEIGWSASLYRLLGLERGRFTPTEEGFFELVHPEDRAFVRAQVEAALRGESPFDARFRIVRPDGSVRWLAARGEVERDADGRPVRVVGINLDVTAQKDAEAQLTWSEERYRTLFTSMSEGFAFCEILGDADGQPADYRFLEVNPAFGRLTGLPSDATRGRTARELLPDLAPHWIEASTRAAECGEAVRFQSYSASLDRWFEVYAFRVGDTRVAHFFHDVTLSHRSEAVMRENEERFRLAAQAVAGMVYDWNVRTNRIFRSEGLKEIIGLTPEEFGGGSEAWRSRIHPEDLSRWDRFWSDALSGTETHVACEYRVRHKDGHWVDVWDRSLLIRDDEGRVVRTVGSTVDISDRKRMETELKAALAQRESALQEVHHRVKNSLQTVSSVMNLQARRIADPAMRAQFEQAIARIHAIAAVHQALYHGRDLTRANIGTYVSTLSQQIASTHQSGSAGRVHLSVEAGDILLPSDHLVPFALILNELLTNAFRHAHKDGRGGTIAVRATAEDGMVRLAVEDDGEGLPEGFDPQRSESLGLKLVLILTQQLGGRLATETLPQGKRFVVNLPILPSAQTSRAPAA